MASGYFTVAQGSAASDHTGWRDGCIPCATHHMCKHQADQLWLSITLHCMHNQFMYMECL